MFVILVPAVVVLWGFPGETADAWSWTIKPDLTPIFLGAGYGAGAYFFLRTFLGERWPPSSAGIFGAAFFATLMLIATLIHWDRFNHGDAPALAAIAFYGWVIVYIVSPFAVGALWWLNRRTDSGEPLPGEPLVPPPVLLAARLFGIGALGAAIVFFVFPETAIDLWPWQLTAADFAGARLVHRPGRRRRAAALHRPALGLVEAAAADVLRRGRAAAGGRRPRLGRLR